MQSSQGRKFIKKYQPLSIIFKMILVLYLIIFSLSYLMTDTVAYFEGENVSNMMISAGTWEDEEEEEEDEEGDEEEKEEPEDESSLSFINEEALQPQTCPTLIEVEVINEGDGSMLSEGSYEVYYIETGNPEKDGEKIALDEGEGRIKILEKGHEKNLVYETSTPGFYQFVIIQDDDGAEEDYIWSEIIEVACEEEISEPENDAESTTESEEEEISEPENDAESTTESEEEPVKQETKVEESKAENDQEENSETDSEEEGESTEEEDVESDEEKTNNEVD